MTLTLSSAKEVPAGHLKEKLSTNFEERLVALKSYLAVGQNQRYHFGVGAPPILVYFSGDWDVHWGHGILTHGHLSVPLFFETAGAGILLSRATWGGGGRRLGLGMGFFQPEKLPSDVPPFAFVIAGIPQVKSKAVGHSSHFDRKLSKGERARPLDNGTFAPAVADVSLARHAPTHRRSFTKYTCQMVRGYEYIVCVTCIS